MKVEDIKKRIRRKEGFSKSIYEDSNGIQRIGSGIVVPTDKHDTGDMPYSRTAINRMFSEQLREAEQAAKRNTRGFSRLPEDAQNDLVIEAFMVGEKEQSNMIAKKKTTKKTKTFTEASSKTEKPQMLRDGTAAVMPNSRTFGSVVNTMMPQGNHMGIQRYNEGTTNVGNQNKTFGSLLGNNNASNLSWKEGDAYKAAQAAKEDDVRNKLGKDESWNAGDRASHGIQGIFGGLEDLIELPGAAYGGVRRGIDYIQGKDAYEGQYGYDVDLTPQGVDDNATEARIKAEGILKSQGMNDEQIKQQLDSHFGAQNVAGSLIDPTIAVSVAPKILKGAKFLATDPDVAGNVKNAYEFITKSDNYDPTFWGWGSDVGSQHSIGARTAKSHTGSVSTIVDGETVSVPRDYTMEEIAQHTGINIRTVRDKWEKNQPMSFFDSAGGEFIIRKDPNLPPVWDNRKVDLGTLTGNKSLEGKSIAEFFNQLDEPGYGLSIKDTSRMDKVEKQFTNKTGKDAMEGYDPDTGVLPSDDSYEFETGQSALNAFYKGKALEVVDNRDPDFPETFTLFDPRITPYSADKAIAGEKARGTAHIKTDLSNRYNLDVANIAPEKLDEYQTALRKYKTDYWEDNYNRTNKAGVVGYQEGKRELILKYFGDMNPTEDTTDLSKNYYRYWWGGKTPTDSDGKSMAGSLLTNISGKGISKTFGEARVRTIQEIRDAKNGVKLTPKQKKDNLLSDLKQFYALDADLDATKVAGLVADAQGLDLTALRKLTDKIGESSVKQLKHRIRALNFNEKKAKRKQKDNSE